MVSGNMKQIGTEFERTVVKLKEENDLGKKTFQDS